MTDISRFCKCFSSVICCRPCRGKTMLWSRTVESLQWKCNVAAEKQKCDFCNLKTVFVRFRLGYICFWCESANFHITLTYFYHLARLDLRSWGFGRLTHAWHSAVGVKHEWRKRVIITCSKWRSQDFVYISGWMHQNNRQDLCFQSACIYKCNWKYR